MFRLPRFALLFSVLFAATLVGQAPEGDLDDNRVVDTADFAILRSCLLGPHIAPTNACVSASLDPDLDIDLKDMARFQRAFGSVGTCDYRWSSVSPDAPLDGGVTSLFVHDDGSGPALFVGGYFGNAGSLPINGIAKWNGKEWTELEGGLTGTPSGAGRPTVNAMIAHDDGSVRRCTWAASFWALGRSRPRLSLAGMDNRGRPSATSFSMVLRRSPSMTMVAGSPCMPRATR